MHACIPGVAQGSEYTSMQSVHILRVYMHKPASYRNKIENVRTLRLAECTRMHACIHALIMYNAYSLSLLPFSFSRLPVCSGCTRFSKPHKRSTAA